LPRGNFSFGRRDTLIAAPQFFSFGRCNLSIAVPEFFFWSAQPIDCRAVIFLLAGVIYRLPRRDFLLAGAIHQLPRCIFSFGQRDAPIAAPQFFFLPARDPSIAAPQFFLLDHVTRRSPRRKFSVGRRNPPIAV
jgi:hypothetical protein